MSNVSRQNVLEIQSPAVFQELHILCWRTLWWLGLTIPLLTEASFYIMFLSWNWDRPKKANRLPVCNTVSPLLNFYDIRVFSASLQTTFCASQHANVGSSSRSRPLELGQWTRPPNATEEKLLPSWHNYLFFDSKKSFCTVLGIFWGTLSTCLPVYLPIRQTIKPRSYNMTMLWT